MIFLKKMQRESNMRRFLLIITVAIIICGLFSGAGISAANGNMAFNGSFEEGSGADADEWTYSSVWVRTAKTNGVAPAKGDYMMKVCATSTAIAPGSAVAVKPNTYYAYSVKIYRTDSKGVAYMNLLDYRNKDIAGTNIGTKRTGEWVTVSGTFYSADHTVIKPRLVVNNDLTGAPIYFDDVQIAEIGSDAIAFPEGEQVSGVVSTFTAHSDSTYATFAITENKLYITSLSTGKAESYEYITKDIEVPLVRRINSMAVNWVFSNYKPVATENGTDHTVTYISDDGNYELKAVWSCKEGVGPLEYNQYITGIKESINIKYSDMVSANIRLELQNEDTPTLYRFSRSRVNDGSDPYFSQGVFLQTLADGDTVYTSVENHFSPVGTILPYEVIDINGNRGVYFGHYWSFGKILVRRQKNNLSVSTYLDDLADRFVIREKGETFNVPGFIIGTYEGDVDDGSNEMKDWFWEYKITRSLYENEGEPYIEAGIISGWNSDMSTQFRIWPDFADYVNIIKLDYGWTVPDGTAPQANKELEDRWIPDIKSNKNGAPYLGLYEALQEQLKKDDSENPVYFSLYMADTYMGLDIGTKEGREAQLQALKERMRPEDNAYGIGYEYWRSDFDVEQRYDYDDHEGLLYILDSMIEYSDDFRYEHCMGAGSLKDFTTLERMTFMTTEDTGFPLNHRMSHYANTYMINPVQLKADINMTISSRNYGAIKAGDILESGLIAHSDPDYVDYALRTSMLGSSMLCFTPNGYSVNLDTIKEHYALYNNVHRPILRNTDVYHILPAPTGWDYMDWDGIEYYNHKLDKGIIQLFKENKDAPTSKTIVLKGLEENVEYKLTFLDRTEQNTQKTGKELMESGFTVSGMTTRYDSEIIYIEPVSKPVSLELAAVPEKTEYKLGEKLETQGLEVFLVYADGTRKQIENYSVSSLGSNYGNCEITVSNGSLFESFTVWVEPPEGWVLDGGRWAYYKDGQRLKNKWLTDAEGWRYLGADGYCLESAWAKDSGGWLYLDENGRILTNAWAKDSKGWCYLDSEGRIVYGNKWIKDSKGWCYVNKKGYALLNTWKKDSKGWVYLDKSGYMAVNKWVKDSKSWCYVGKDGYCVLNKWVKDSKGWCYLDKDGRMLSSKWLTYKGDKYYLDKNGHMVTGYKVIDGRGCYFSPDGVLLN